MGASQEEKSRNHDRIVEITAERIRKDGTAAPGVAEIMAAAGLTHGGFYKHFGSRDDLIEEAVAAALSANDALVEEIVGGAADPLAAFVDWYASRHHCDDPATGCAVVALGADAARSGPGVRAAYTRRVEHYLDGLGRLLGRRRRKDRRDAVTSFCALVGGVLVARAVDDPELAEEILRDVRESVTSQTFG